MRQLVESPGPNVMRSWLYALGRGRPGLNAVAFGSETTFHRKVALSFVIPSEAEGSAVLRTLPGNVFRQALQGRPCRRRRNNHHRFGGALKFKICRCDCSLCPFNTNPRGALNPSRGQSARTPTYRLIESREQPRGVDLSGNGSAGRTTPRRWSSREFLKVPAPSTKPP